MSELLPSPSFRPLYEQIKILLTQSLVAGEWKPGEAIPSEMELAARYRVSQGTVRRAIDELASEHILVRRQGKGTFVASHSEPSYQYRFLRLIPDAGQRPFPHNVLLEVRKGKAGTDIARALGVKSGAAVHVIKRILEFEGRPVVFDEIVLAASRFPGFTVSRLEEFKGSMYSFYEAGFGLRMVRAEERIRAVAAAAAPAAHLQVTQGTPLLCVDRVAFTYGDMPVEWRRGLCRTDGFSYYNELA